MTDPSPGGDVSQQSVGEAVAELDLLKELLQRAGRGEAEAGEVQQAVTDFMRDHSETLTTTVTALGEQARTQVLAELYRWRAQLEQQRVGGRSAPSAGRPGEE